MARKTSPPLVEENQPKPNDFEAILRYHRHLSRLLDFVTKHIDEPISLSDVAADAGISSSRLSSLFREKTGTVFHEWLRAKRIQLAQELLRANEQRISDVAFSVGFRSSRTFERSFMIVTGTTASDFRKSITNKLTQSQR